MASDAARPAPAEASTDARALEVRRTSASAQPSFAVLNDALLRLQAAPLGREHASVLLRSLLRFLFRHSVPVAKSCSETTCEAHGAAYVRLEQTLVCHSTLALYFFACLAFAAAETVF